MFWNSDKNNMIFVTVGTQLPFDRLIRGIDEIAPHLNGEKIIAQTCGGQYIAGSIECRSYIPSDEFDAIVKQSRLIVSHAGVGIIITALMLGKPCIVMPRLVSLGEHRSDHQLATAKKMQELGLVNVVYNNRQLRDLLLYGNILCLHHLGNKASDELIKSIMDFIEEK